ncbi:AEC family transporter [Hoeflea poritis]|uniref:AEC family transporter n=1 Tax=Hoeflea poritis TaxID=2993659 RepID=A0ABT4VKS6_9HYPH|nr:AEC family transporter [Hoeflea poritis]MDA4845275.1 AEC family transporter [Hoeflea poritis]
MEVVELIFPVFAVIVTGYVFSRLGLLPDGVGDSLIQFLFYVAIPALLFVVIAQEETKALLNWPFIVSFGGATVVVFLLMLAFAIYVLKSSAVSATMLAMIAVASNTGIVGLPLLHSLFGNKVIVLAALANILVVLLIIIQVFLLEATKPKEPDEVVSILAHLKKVLLNPVILSTILGLAYAISPLSLPKIVVNYLDVLSAAVAPCALFAVGMSIRPASIVQSGSTVILAASAKLIVLPALALLIVLSVGADPLVAVAVVVSAALPTAKNEFILAKQYHQSEELAAQTVSLTTAISIVTLILWLLALSRIYPDSFSI